MSAISRWVSRRLAIFRSLCRASFGLLANSPMPSRECKVCGAYGGSYVSMLIVKDGHPISVLVTCFECQKQILEGAAKGLATALEAAHGLSPSIN